MCFYASNRVIRTIDQGAAARPVGLRRQVDVVGRGQADRRGQHGAQEESFLVDFDVL